MAIAEEVRTFIARNFLFQEDGSALDAGASLIGTGVVDSTGILELVSFLEETWGVKVEDAEMVPENLDSVANVVAFVERKLAASSPAG